MGDKQTSSIRLGRVAVVVATLIALVLSAAARVDAQESDASYPLLFPVAGQTSWSDTWGAPRSEGRTHEGTDIFAAKGTPVVAAADGKITRISVGERAGRYIVITHDDGWSSYYMHLNNDTPGTDDGLLDATPDGIAVGVQVSAGDVIDFVGDSGNAESTPSHLHFELHEPDGSPINPAPHLRAAVTGTLSILPEVLDTPRASLPLFDAEGVDLVGRVDPGSGFNAGLAVYNQIAYMGTWGRDTTCPGTGVRVIDATDPTAPQIVATVADGAEFPGTSADGVWVGTMDTESFTGDVAVVTVRLCDTSERNRRSDLFRGLAIYDVTDPADPSLLSTFDTGAFTQGANDVVGAVRADGTVIVSTTVMQSYLHTGGEQGDWRLLDITDPMAPSQLADWDYRATLAEDDPNRRSVDFHAHTSLLSDDGNSVWVAVWDGGMVELDISAAPQVIRHVALDENDEGNAHSIAIDREAGVLIRNDEDLDWSAEPDETGTWGTQTLYDISDVNAVVPMATFATERSDLSDGSPAAPGYFSAHEIVLSGDLEYLSWYSDGLRVVDVSDPTTPVEVAHFVPTPTADPQQHFRGQGRGEAFAMTWSVRISDGLIYLSDLNSGLWIVQLSGGATLATAAM